MDEVTIAAAGLNGKMSEVNAAFGLLQLKHISKALQQRKTADCYYRNALKNITGIKLFEPVNLDNHNFSYFPILIEKEYPLTRDELYLFLKRNNIHARRYFYPLISDTTQYSATTNKKNLKNAKTTSEKILCLPIYPEIENVDTF